MNRKKVEDYFPIIGNETVAKIYKEAKPLYDMKIVHINSTTHGGGVAEILNTLIPLLKDMGIDAEWKVISGSQRFFEITKKIHNALQGNTNLKLTGEDKNLYMRMQENFSLKNFLHHDMVVVHDPQPLGIIKFYPKNQPWIWRCHLHLSSNNINVWKFVRFFISKYNLAILSSKEYVTKDFPIPYRIVYPAIDPLSPKNRDISNECAENLVEKAGVPLDKPYILQVSRFDPWKDPIGVIRVFKIVREKIPCRLVLCGGLASDDPEGMETYLAVKREAKELIEKGEVMLILDANDLTVNALQRKASVIIQKSIKEGFGLTVTEAMWKSKPVVASRVGGINIQVVDGKNGFLADPMDYGAFAVHIIKLLRDKELAGRIGKRAKESVQKKFLITSLLMDHIKIYKKLKKQGKGE